MLYLGSAILSGWGTVSALVHWHNYSCAGRDHCCPSSSHGRAPDAEAKLHWCWHYYNLRKPSPGIEMWERWKGADARHILNPLQMMDPPQMLVECSADIRTSTRTNEQPIENNEKNPLEKLITPSAPPHPWLTHTKSPLIRSCATDSQPVCAPVCCAKWPLRCSLHAYYDSVVRRKPYRAACVGSRPPPLLSLPLARNSVVFLANQGSMMLLTASLLAGIHPGSLACLSTVGAPLIAHSNPS